MRFQETMILVVAALAILAFVNIAAGKFKDNTPESCRTAASNSTCNDCCLDNGLGYGAIVKRPSCFCKMDWNDPCYGTKTEHKCEKCCKKSNLKHNFVENAYICECDV